MKNINLIFFVCIMQLTASFQSDEWFLLESKNYGYKITFPHKPEETPKEVDSEIGKLKMNIFMYDASKKSKDDNLIYMVNYTEYPGSMINSDNKQTLPDFYKNSIAGVIKNVQGKLLSEKDIELKGYLGKEIQISFKDGLAIINMRSFLIKNKMYIIETITESKKHPNESITRFMNSFDLLQ